MELHHVESGEWEDVYTKLRIKFSTEETDGYGVPVIGAAAESDTYSISSVMVLEEYASEWSDWSHNSIDDIYDADYDSVFDGTGDDREIDTDLLA